MRFSVGFVVVVECFIFFEWRQLDRDAIMCDHRRGLSLRKIDKTHRISRATVHRVIHAQSSTENAA